MNDESIQLYEQQLAVWDEFRERVRQLDEIECRTFDMGGYTIKAQFNPARAVSSGAKLDKKSIAARKCFLCAENRPAIQEGVALNERFTLLVNPFPILKEHFTLPLNSHSPQEIKPYIEDMLDFAQRMPQHILFYNGPQCGASAPDHIHFQAVKRGQLPLEEEWRSLERRTLSDFQNDKMEELLNYGRKCIHIEAKQKRNAISFFNQNYTQYQLLEKRQDEPKMNVFCFYEEGRWHLFVFPRKTHRPKQFYAEGDAFMMISPGAIDIAGVLVLPRKKDFDSITREEIESIFQEVSYQ